MHQNVPFLFLLGSQNHIVNHYIIHDNKLSLGSRVLYGYTNPLYSGYIVLCRYCIICLCIKVMPQEDQNT